MYKRIKELREDKDLTQSQISKYLNMSQTGYSKYETGENDVPTKILIELANFYNTSVDYLLNLTNETIPYKRDKKKRIRKLIIIISNPINYLQNLCFPIVTVNGLDQIHLFVAVLGLK